jgi:tetratricopeptide (TPR) repeat protein
LEKKSYTLQVVANGIVTKPIRIWHTSRNLAFFNPIYETVEDNNPGFLETILYADRVPAISDEAHIIAQWKKDKPLSPTPLYYEAYMHLNAKRYDNFIQSARAYLFKEQTGMTSVMMRYYMASVYFYIKSDPKNATPLLLQCLVANPFMAEFWCLLGDILYQSQQYAKAHEMYENAKIIGSRRLKSDPWPFHVVKYGEYPEKMMENCGNLLRNPTHSPPL